MATAMALPRLIRPTLTVGKGREVSEDPPDTENGTIEPSKSIVGSCATMQWTCVNMSWRRGRRERGDLEQEFVGGSSLIWG